MRVLELPPLPSAKISIIQKISAGIADALRPMPQDFRGIVLVVCAFGVWTHHKSELVDTNDVSCIYSTWCINKIPGNPLPRH
jgi:hypothetical protein